MQEQYFLPAPTYSPIVNSINRKQNHVSFPPKTRPASGSLDASQTRPKYQCPGCLQIFVKWSPCLSHLREKHSKEYAFLLDKKLNGGDFRRAQELCAAQLSQQPSVVRGERTESIDSLSSEDDSLGEDLMAQLRVSVPPRTATTSKKKPEGSSSSVFHTLPERAIFRLFTFLEVESAQNLYTAMQLGGGGTIEAVTTMSSARLSPPRPIAHKTSSRVRIWSNASSSGEL